MMTYYYCCEALHPRRIQSNTGDFPAMQWSLSPLPPSSPQTKHTLQPLVPTHLCLASRSKSQLLSAGNLLCIRYVVRTVSLYCTEIALFVTPRRTPWPCYCLSATPPLFLPRAVCLGSRGEAGLSKKQQKKQTKSRRRRMMQRRQNTFPAPPPLPTVHFWLCNYAHLVIYGRRLKAERIQKATPPSHIVCVTLCLLASQQKRSGEARQRLGEPVHH